MVAFVVKDFGGEIPRQGPRLLPDNMADLAINTDLAAGPLDGLPQPELVIALTAPWPIRKAYRMPGVNPGDPDVWMPLPSEFSCVCLSPLANDTLHRIFWTNPPGSPDAGAWWNTYAGLRAGTPHWSMGFIPADPNSKPVVTYSGGTTPPPPLIERSYCYTLVDQYGSESSPSAPSDVVAGPSDAVWHVANLPAAAPAMPPGKNYPPPITTRLYRTITGETQGAEFYFVVDLPIGTTAYDDSIPDTTVVDNNLLQSVSWAPPVDDLDGLISMPGGMLVGFSKNTMHFCEPDRPNAWPAGYDQSLIYPIKALAVWQQSLVVLTEGFPSTGSGTSPGQFMFAQVQAPEPCIARGSVVTDLAGVYYASSNGLIALNYFGAQNQTLSNMTREMWNTDYQASKIIACRHRAQYLAINGTGMGFIIDYTEQRMGICQLSTFAQVVSVWNDVYTGDAYMMADNSVYRWDGFGVPALPYKWRSKEFYMAAPVSLGACQISCDPSITDPAPADVTPMPPSHQPHLATLPNGVNATFRIYTGPNQARLVHEEWLYQARNIFRIPGGFKAFSWQFEILSRVPIHSVELASTMRELKTV